MEAETLPSDSDYTHLRLGEAAHVIASETDRDRVVETALRNLSHFGRSEHVELLLIDEESISAKSIGLLADGKIKKPTEDIQITGTVLGEIVGEKCMRTYITSNGCERLCVPMIGSNERVIGLTIIDLDSESNLTDSEKEKINILSMMIGVSLDRIRYIQMSMFDKLTGLYNRRQFDIRLKEEMARIKRYGGSIGLVMADIDYFKRLNDTYGHLQGDIVLQEMAVILRDAVRKNVDIPCRFGGEELMIIMPNTDVEGAFSAAERFRVSCEEHPFTAQDKPLTVTVSGGVAAIEGDSGITVNEFIGRVDTMLYKAKESGRNRIYVWR
ncbi:GGDEF domain-containing protein [bacterium]|nr:GGDEF domain-containing protein [bacterium]